MESEGAGNQGTIEVLAQIHGQANLAIAFPLGARWR
jgi:hypothetical protein